MSGPAPNPIRTQNPAIRQLLGHVDATTKRARVCREAGYAINILSQMANGSKNVNLQTFADLCEAAGLEITLKERQHEDATDSPAHPR